MAGGARAAIRAEVPGLLRLAVPIVVGMAASTLLGVTDSVMLAPLGPVPLAAVGLTNAVAMILYAGIFGLLSVVPVRIGAAAGARGGRRIPALLRSGLWLGGAAGAGGAAVMALVWPLLPRLGQPAEVVAALPGYWACLAVTLLPWALLTAFKGACEAVGRPWLAAGFAFVAVVVNVPLNYALIWGIGPLPPLGLTGAGLATLAAETIALAAAVLWWQRARGAVRLRARGPARAAEVRGMLREGLPMGASWAAETGANGVVTLIIGTFGTVALAANQLAMAVGNVLYMIPLGVAGAVAIRVAQEKGAANAAALRPVVLAALAVATAWLSASALVLWSFGRPILALIADEPEVVALAAAICAVFAAMQVFDGVQTTMTGALRGLSDTAYPAALTMFAYWGVGLPLGWFLAVTLGLGPVWVWVGWLVALAGVALPLVLRVLGRTRRAGLLTPVPGV
jgi:MATE family multidrug resistance protein